MKILLALFLSCSIARAEFFPIGGAPFSAGNLTSSTTGVTITGGTSAVNGSGAAVNVQSATDSVPGLMTAADHAILTGLRVQSYTGFIEAGSDKTYVIDEYAKYAGTINDFTVKTVSGTVTIAIQINGTPVTGLSAVAASSVQGTSTASAANTFAAGNRIQMVWSSSSSPTDLAFTLKYTR